MKIEMWSVDRVKPYEHNPRATTRRTPSATARNNGPLFPPTVVAIGRCRKASPWPTPVRRPATIPPHEF